MAPERSRAVNMALAGLALILAVWAGLGLFDLIAGGGGDLERTRRDLGKMQSLAAEYHALAGERERLASAGNQAQGTLYAILDGIMRRHRLDKRVQFMKPTVREGDDGLTEEVVAMGVAGLYSDELVRFLHQVEIDAGGLYVESANIRRTKTGMLDAELTVSMAVPEG